MKNLRLKKSKTAETMKKVRWPLGCLLFLLGLAACSAEGNADVNVTETSPKETARINRAWRTVGELKHHIRSGDLVTRTGNDFTSESLRNLNRRNTKYSHCGIAIVENDTVFVYHALGGEFNPDQKIKRDRWEEFAEPYSNRGVGIFRFRPHMVSLPTLKEVIRSFIAQGVTFDMDFDLATENKMYCAEFVAKSFRAGSADSLTFPVSRIRDFEFFGVDDLFLHPACDSITAAVYK